MNKIIIAAAVAAIATQAQAAGVANVEIGKQANINGNGSIAIGQHTDTQGSLSVAVGSHAKTGAGMASAYGSAANAAGESSTAIGKGTLSSGKASAAFGAHATAAGNSSVAAGLHTKAAGGQSTAIGQAAHAKADQSAAFGSGATTEGRFSTAIGTNAKANNAHDVALGSFSTTGEAVKVAGFAGSNPAAVVSVGNDTLKRQIQNVAAGRLNAESTDAVNGSQLHATNQRVANLQTLIDNGLGDINKRIEDNRKEARAGIAGAHAVAAIPQPHAVGQIAIGAGAGYYGGESAGAIGISRISDSGKWVVKGAVSTDTARKVGAAVGLSYVIGGVKQIQPAPVVIKEVVREVIVREVAAPTAAKIRG